MSSFGVLTASDLLVWAQQQNVGGSFFINPPVTTSGLPDIPDKYFIGSLEIGKTVDRRLILTNNNLRTFVNKSLLRAGESQMSWTGWKEIPTATPPQEYSLPVADGFSSNPSAKYWKDQFNQVHFRVYCTTQSSLSSGGVIATLPEGFRPDVATAFVSGSLSVATRKIGSLNILPNGSIAYYGDVIPSGSTVFGSGVFVAAS